MVSKLNTLIVELCPDGVEVVQLCDVLNIRNGKDYKCFSDGNIPVYGSGGIIAYIDTFACDKPSVLIPRKGSLNNLYYVDMPFWTVDTIFWTDIKCDIVLPKFVFYYLQMQHLEDLNMAGGVPSLTQTILNKIEFPLPPLPIQREIVRILDNFTELTVELTVELTAELTARKKQYEYYRNELLTFGDDVPIVPLGEIADVRDGTHDTPKKTSEGRYLITSKNITSGIIDLSTAYYISESDYFEINKRSKVDKGDLLITMIGTVGEVALVEDEPNFAIKNIGLIKCRNYQLSRFLFHYMQCSQARNHISSNMSKGSQAFLGLGKLRTFPIPLPFLEAQNRIVDVLDKFDALTTDISVGLLAEIEARHKQYEFYRDKLLTFERKEVEA